MTEFEERLSLLKQVRESWANGVKVIVQAVTSEQKSECLISCPSHSFMCREERVLIDIHENLIKLEFPPFL